MHRKMDLSQIANLGLISSVSFGLFYGSILKLIQNNVKISKRII